MNTKLRLSFADVVAKIAMRCPCNCLQNRKLLLELWDGIGCIYGLCEGPHKSGLLATAFGGWTTFLSAGCLRIEMHHPCTSSRGLKTRAVEVTPSEGLRGPHASGIAPVGAWVK